MAYTTQVPLGTACPFAILAGSGITNIPTSVITGNVGLSPATGAAITGLTCAEVTGTIYSVDAAGPLPCRVTDPALLTLAKSDLLIAVNYVNGLVGTPIAPILDGQILVAGVYDAGAANLGMFGPATLTLDAEGDPNAVFIIKTTSLTTGSGPGVATVSLINGAQAKNVFWLAISSASIGTFTDFSGTIMAITSITVATSATIDGRLLARNGNVTLDQNEVAAPACPSCTGTITLSPISLPLATQGQPYSQIITATGGTAPYTWLMTATPPAWGLTIDPNTGVLSSPSVGFPPPSGSFTIIATDANGCTGTRTYQFIANNAECPIITISPSTLPNGQINVPYNQALSASGGVGTYNFAPLFGGSLPTGLTINASGVISGTPTVVGTFNFTVRARDQSVVPGFCSGLQSYTIIISEVPRRRRRGTYGAGLFVAVDQEKCKPITCLDQLLGRQQQ